MHTYPTALALAAMGVTLARDVCLWSLRLEREYYTADYCAPNVPPVLLPTRKHVRTGRTPRVFKSRYVGVTEHRDRWIAQWGPRGAVKSRVYPKTPEGELQAAWERARALGLSAPEVRS
jgi:hypothetical protein